MNAASGFLPALALWAVLTGFRLDDALVPREEILAGGPPKDGIPAILQPKFVHPPEVVFLSPDDLVIAVEVEGEAKAYPIKILNWHEVVNDIVGRIPVVVTF